jgi:hypothetical protein
MKQALLTHPVESILATKATEKRRKEREVCRSPASSGSG